MKYKCPVCGYTGLSEAPYNTFGYGSYEICACCGFEFGVDDYPNKLDAMEEWKKRWIENGYPWFSKSKHPPVNWDPAQQVSGTGDG